MKFLYDNWSLLVIIACIGFVVFLKLRRFSELPTETQMNKIKEYLLYCVIEAEKSYQGGTGALKLRAVYSQFCQVFPSFVPLISFEIFSKLVDEALEQMHHLLDTNENIAKYVKGE